MRRINAPGGRRRTASVLRTGHRSQCSNSGSLNNRHRSLQIQDLDDRRPPDPVTVATSHATPSLEPPSYRMPSVEDGGTKAKTSDSRGAAL